MMLTWFDNIMHDQSICQTAYQLLFSSEESGDVGSRAIADSAMRQSRSGGLGRLFIWIALYNMESNQHVDQ
jgi:hypothetical protein